MKAFWTALKCQGKKSLLKNMKLNYDVNIWNFSPLEVQAMFLKSTPNQKPDDNFA